MQNLKATLLVGAIALLVAGCGEMSATSDAAMRSAKTIGQLPEEDRQLALDQWSCPACGDVLGSTGVPVKQQFDGKAIFFKTQQCADEYGKNPKHFQSKMSE